MSRKADDIRRQKELENSASTAVKAKESPKTDDEFTAAVDEYLKKQGFVEKVEDNSKDIQELKKKVEDNSKDIQELKKNYQKLEKKEDNSTTFFKINEISTASENTLAKSVHGTEALLASGTVQRTFKLVYAAGNYYSENKAAVEQATGEKAVLKYIWTDSKEFLTADDLEHLGIIDNTQE